MRTTKKSRETDQNCSSSVKKAAPRIFSSFFRNAKKDKKERKSCFQIDWHGTLICVSIASRQTHWCNLSLDVRGLFTSVAPAPPSTNTRSASQSPFRANYSFLAEIWTSPHARNGHKKASEYISNGRRLPACPSFCRARGRWWFSTQVWIHFK